MVAVLKTNRTKQEYYMKNKQEQLNDSRRQMAKRVAAGVTIAGVAWKTPVVRSVVLPAHAQTSSEQPPCVPLVCAADGSITCSGSLATWTITSESASLCPPREGLTVVRDVIGVSASGTIYPPLSNATFVTDAHGVATGPGGTNSSATAPSICADNQFYVRITLQAAPEVEPCLALLPIVV